MQFGIAESAAARLVLLYTFFFGGGQEKTEKMLKFQPHSAMFCHVLKLRFLFTYTNQSVQHGLVIDSNNLKTT